MDIALSDAGRSIADDELDTTNGIQVDDEILQLIHEFRRLWQNDPKDAFISDLICRYDQLKRQQQQRMSEVSSGSDDEKLQAAQREIKRLKASIACDPFVTLLIDGDGMIFHKDLLQQGETGGKQAAALLRSNTLRYLEDTHEHLPADTKVLCRVYANVRGLGDTLCKAGIIEAPPLLEQFVNGFTRGFNLFDYVDVGPGKDRADEKIGENFKLQLRDSHCRYLLLGVSHDNGFARMLEEPILDEELRRKIVLVKGVPFEKELLALDLPSVQFGNLFRDKKIVLPSVTVPTRPDTPQTPGALTRSTTCSDISEITLPKIVVPTVPLTWAGLAAAPAPVSVLSPLVRIKSPLSAPSTPKIEEPSLVSTISDSEIPRNRKGQRVDPPYRNYDKDEVDRVKKMKLCNSHYLLARCYRETCGHNHEYKPTKTELDILKLVARMAPCVNSAACEDATCIYGHRCPFPKKGTDTRREKGVKKSKSLGSSADSEDAAGKTCIFGSGCKFAEAVHDLDCVVVRLTKIR